MVDYYAQLHRAIVFVEDKLGEDIGFRDIASEAAYLSPCHFLRVFEAVLGLSPTEYLRERRLSVAAFRLVETDDRLIEIALDTRYESQEAFTRAFKRRFGATPGRYRERGVHASIPSRQPYSLDDLRRMTGGIEMEPKFEMKEAFTVVGLAGPSSQANNRIPALWTAFLPRSGEVGDRIGTTSYGICQYLDPASMDENSEWEELVGVEAKGTGPLPGGMSAKTIPGRRYAVFTHKGSLDTLGTTYDYIYKTYLPRSGLALAQAPDFECYDERFRPDAPELSEMYIYIPLEE